MSNRTESLSVIIIRSHTVIARHAPFQSKLFKYTMSEMLMWYPDQPDAIEPLHSEKQLFGESAWNHTAHSPLTTLKVYWDIM